jgi:hypothetical protein
MKSTRAFEQEFENWHPFENFPGVTREEYQEAVAKYVDKRLAWELENGGMYQIGMIIGMVLFWAIIGMVVMYAIDRWRDNCTTQIRSEVSSE